MNAFGIDLGTSNIKIYGSHGSKYFMEKNMIAIEGKKRLYAYGDSAFEMYEKAPDNITVSFPLNYGVIADIENMQSLMKHFLSDIQNGSLKPAEFYVAVPTQITEVEKRAFYELIKDSGVKAKRIMMVEKAAADALGMDVDIKSSQGMLLVDVGFATTEISILSLGGIVVSRLLKNGGQKFDEAIKNAVRKEYGVLIGSKTAEKVKYSIREMSNQNKNAIVYGRDIVTGLPMEKSIDRILVKDCLAELYDQIIDNIMQVLERTPPELGADIYHHGIYLTGGASQVSYLKETIEQKTGLKVNTTGEPMASVVKGLAHIIKNEKYRSLAFMMEGVR